VPPARLPPCLPASASPGLPRQITFLGGQKRKAFDLGPQLAVLHRLHRLPPPPFPPLQVSALCESLGSPLDLGSGAAPLAASLAAAVAAAPPALGSLIKSLATRAMSEAEYFCTGGCVGGWTSRSKPGWGWLGCVLLLL
jgi:hypothetical protein